MSSTKITLLAVAMAAFVAGCAKQAEEVVYVEEPVSVEPTYTSKYK